MKMDLLGLGVPKYQRWGLMRAAAVRDCSHHGGKACRPASSWTQANHELSGILKMTHAAQENFEVRKIFGGQPFRWLAISDNGENALAGFESSSAGFTVHFIQECITSVFTFCLVIWIMVEC